MEYISNSEKETYAIAKKFSKHLKGGEVITMNGDLGAGKTTFTKGLAKALGIKQHITSPTFTLMNEYETKKFKLCHFDMYRIDDADELQEIGLTEYFNSKTVCVIEWAEKIKDLLPNKIIEINITKISDNSRKYEIII